MIEKRFLQSRHYCIDKIRKRETTDWDTVIEWLNELSEENGQLKKNNLNLQEDLDYFKAKNSSLETGMFNLERENDQLKQQINDCKKDEKQLSISFIEFKMQLIKVLQQNYNYAYNQRQKNLDNSIVARTYEVLYQTIDNIAETMNVDIGRFPKNGDVEWC